MVMANKSIQRFVINFLELAREERRLLHTGQVEFFAPEKVFTTQMGLNSCTFVQTSDEISSQNPGLYGAQVAIPQSLTMVLRPKGQERFPCSIACAKYLYPFTHPLSRQNLMANKLKTAMSMRNFKQNKAKRFEDQLRSNVINALTFVSCIS